MIDTLFASCRGGDGDCIATEFVRSLAELFGLCFCDLVELDRGFESGVDCGCEAIDLGVSVLDGGDQLLSFGCNPDGCAVGCHTLMYAQGVKNLPVVGESQ